MFAECVLGITYLGVCRSVLRQEPHTSDYLLRYFDIFLIMELVVDNYCEEIVHEHCV